MAQEAAKNSRKFKGYAVLLCVLGIVFMFLYSGLQNDQINIIQAFITEQGGGWAASATQLPMTVGNFVCITPCKMGAGLIQSDMQKALRGCCVAMTV